LFRKGAGKEAKLCHMGHLMVENRNGFIIDTRLTEANGTAERTSGHDMIEANPGPGTPRQPHRPATIHLQTGVSYRTRLPRGHIGGDLRV
jgi:hypothetical protein